jgi:hypothetical protein
MEHQMTIKDPPNWGNDSLSSFIKAGYENSFATFVNMKQDYNKLNKIDSLFEKAIGYLHNSPEWFIGFFLLRSHSTYLGAVRLSMSTQVYESYMVLRGCLEAALYGFLISKDTSAKEIWVERHDNDHTLKKMKKTFQIGSIFSLLEKADDKVYQGIKALYDRTIDLGAHPNPQGVMATLEINEDEEQIGFHMGYLTKDPLQIRLALRTTAQVGVGALLLFRNIFPERFEITGLSDELKHLSIGL